VLDWCYDRTLSSADCIRELLSACIFGKPVFTLFEADPKQGGLTMDQVLSGLRAALSRLGAWGLVDELSKRGHELPSFEQLHAKIMEHPPLEWSSIPAFRDTALRLLVEPVLEPCRSKLPVRSPYSSLRESSQSSSSVLFGGRSRRSVPEASDAAEPYDYVTRMRMPMTYDAAADVIARHSRGRAQALREKSEAVVEVATPAMDTAVAFSPSKSRRAGVTRRALREKSEAAVEMAISATSAAVASSTHTLRETSGAAVEMAMSATATAVASSTAAAQRCVSLAANHALTMENSVSSKRLRRRTNRDSTDLNPDEIAAEQELIREAQRTYIPNCPSQSMQHLYLTPPAGKHKYHLFISSLNLGAADLARELQARCFAASRDGDAPRYEKVGVSRISSWLPPWLRAKPAARQTLQWYGLTTHHPCVTRSAIRQSHCHPVESLFPIRTGPRMWRS
jgi:hypothetical protein